jgi:hypothetical protein
MPPKKGDPEQTVSEKILVEASRIYDARDGEEDSKDLKSYAAFLSRQDAFYKVHDLCVLMDLSVLGAGTGGLASSHPKTCTCSNCSHS